MIIILPHDQQGIREHSFPGCLTEWGAGVTGHSLSLGSTKMLMPGSLSLMKGGLPHFRSSSLISRMFLAQTLPWIRFLPSCEVRSALTHVKFFLKSESNTPISEINICVTPTMCGHMCVCTLLMFDYPWHDIMVDLICFTMYFKEKEE